MPNIKDWNPGDQFQIVIYGKSGVGKTFLAGQWPRPRFIDFDRGIATLASPNFTQLYGKPDIEYFQPVERHLNNRGIPTTHNAFDDACKYFDMSMSDGERDKFDTWVLDTCTTLAQAARTKGIILLGTPQYGNKSKTQTQALATGLIDVKQADYGSERNLVEQFIRMLRDSGKHVLILAHEKEVTDDRGNLTARVPLLTGQSSEVVSGMFDEVWRLTMSGVGATRKRSLQTETNTVNMAKTRLGVPDGTEGSYGSVRAALDGIKASVEGRKVNLIGANNAAT